MTTDKDTLIRLQRDIVLELLYNVRAAASPHLATSGREAKRKLAKIDGMIQEGLNAYGVLSNEINNIDRAHREQEAKFVEAMQKGKPTPIPADAT